MFQRNHQGVSLTKEGELFLPFAQKSMETLNLGITTVNNYLNARKKTITIVSMTPMTSTFLPMIIDTFTRQNPDCGFEILRMFSTQIRKSLSEGNFDIYIGEESDIIVDDSWEKTIIKSNPLGLIVRKNENLDSLSEIKKFILEHHVFLLPEEDAPAMTRLSRKLLNSYGADFSLCEEISPVESIMFNIVSGIGYSFLPENNVLLKAFDLQYIPLDTNERLNMAIAYRKNAPSHVHKFSNMVINQIV